MAKIYYADFWGLREGKNQALFQTDVNDTEWTELTPHSPFYLFVSRDEAQLEEYENGWKVTDIFQVNSVGIVTARDDFVLDFDEKVLRNRIEEFRGNSLSDDEIRDKYELKDNKGWNVTDARTEIRKDNDYQKAFAECLYRPFDIRPLFYHKAVIERTRSEVMRHMLAGKNVALLCKRQSKLSPFSYVFVSNMITESSAFESLYANNSVLPLYLYPTEGEMEIQQGRRPNLNPEFTKAVSEKLGLKFVEDGRGDLEQTFGPEDIFNYAYAVFHSPAYRSRYAEFLKIDFPRLPLTSDKKLFKALAEKGAELVAQHLMESPMLNNLITGYPVVGSNTVDRASYDDNNQRVHINKTQYFEGVSPEVWDFHIGGYQVCQKWLKDRKGRTLTYDDLTHYQKVIVALKETIRLMEEIDALIPAWPLT